MWEKRIFDYAESKMYIGISVRLYNEFQMANLILYMFSNAFATSDESIISERTSRERERLYWHR